MKKKTHGQHLQLSFTSLGQRIVLALRTHVTRTRAEYTANSASLYIFHVLLRNETFIMKAQQRKRIHYRQTQTPASPTTNITLLMGSDRTQLLFV